MATNSYYHHVEGQGAQLSETDEILSNNDRARNFLQIFD